jgi:hypothetical protein
MWIVYGPSKNVYVVEEPYYFHSITDQSHNQGLARLTLTIDITPPNNLDTVTLEYFDRVEVPDLSVSGDTLDLWK